MSTEKTSKEIYAEYIKAKNEFAPFEAAMNSVIRDAVKKAKEFVTKSSWFESEYKWVADIGYSSFYEYDGEFYFTIGYYEYNDEKSITLDRLEDIVSILEADKAAYDAKEAAREVKAKEKRKAKLKAELAELEANA